MLFRALIKRVHARKLTKTIMAGFLGPKDTKTRTPLKYGYMSVLWSLYQGDMAA